MKMTRRDMLSLAGAVGAASSLPAKAADEGNSPATPGLPPDDLPEAHKKKLKVIFAGAHVDD
jgi:hypothetical protein